MDKVVTIGSSESSPRSTLGWKDYWVNYESGRFSPTKSKRFVGRRSSDFSDGPRTPPPQLERQQFRSGSLSPIVDLDADGRLCRGLLDSEAVNAIKGRHAARVSEEPCGHSSPTPTLGALPLGTEVKRGRQAHPSELPEKIWRQDPTVKNSPLPPSSSGRSSGCLSARYDDDSNSVGISDEDSTRNVGFRRSSRLSGAATQGQNGRPRNHMRFSTSGNDDLNSIKSCVKRAIDLGIKVQHCDSLEMSRLRRDKTNAEEEVEKWGKLNRALEQKMSILRAEMQKVQWERELDVLAFNKAIQGLEQERNTVMEAARNERMRNDKLQSEVDCVLSLLVEEKLKCENERAAHDTALRSERKKLQGVKKERDTALKALQDGTQKLNTERDAMVIAMRDLNSKLDFERDANLSSMRRESLDMATTMSPGFRLSGNRKNSLTKRVDDPLFSRPPSRRNSRQF